MSSLFVKVCGLRDFNNAMAVAALGVDYLGFVFVPASPRNAEGLVKAGELTKLGEKAATVLVVKDRPLQELTRLLSDLPFSAVQLHGSESPDYCRGVRSRFPFCKIFKACSVDDQADLSLVTPYEGVVDCLIFDSRSQLGGGSGQKFEWSKLASITGRTPFILSGGVGPDDAESVRQAAQEYPQLCGVDLNSRFESEPGIKSVELVTRFVKELRA